MALFDKLLGRETRAELETKVRVSDQYRMDARHLLDVERQRAARLQAALDLVIAEGHFRNVNGRLLTKGKLPSHLRDKLGLD